jgi:ATP-dependent Clp protease ATP-binding subunit ClpB
VAEARAGRFDPVIGRDVEVRRLLQILERRFKNHPLARGRAGRRQDQRSSARSPTRIAKRRRALEPRLGTRVYELDTGALVAGAKLRGEIEQRLKSLVDELRAAPTSRGHRARGRGHRLAVRPGRRQGAGVGDLLKPLLARGEIRIIATTTPEGCAR